MCWGWCVDAVPRSIGGLAVQAHLAGCVKPKPGDRVVREKPITWSDLSDGTLPLGMGNGSFLQVSRPSVESDVGFTLSLPPHTEESGGAQPPFQSSPLQSTQVPEGRVRMAHGFRP
jgi:hypothetical protein